LTPEGGRHGEADDGNEGRNPAHDGGSIQEAPKKEKGHMLDHHVVKIFRVGSLILKYALVIQHTISQDAMISRINFWLADTDGFI